MLVKKALSSFIVIILLTSMMTSVMLGRLTLVKADNQNTPAPTSTQLITTAPSDSNEDTGWPMFQHDSALIGYSNSTGPTSNQTSWSHLIKGPGIPFCCQWYSLRWLVRQ